MCVIMYATRTRPTPEMIIRAFEHNKDGAGIAWREGRGDNREVVWKKGLNLDEVQHLCLNAPLPYTVHFRVASVGGVKAGLTHPFPITPEVNLDLEGRTRGAVLFHNGHWAPWADKALDAGISANRRFPVGDWSDTRAIAWLMDVFGPGFFNVLNTQKGIIFTADPADTDIFTGTNGWDKINDVWCSNDFFWAKNRAPYTTSAYRRMCSVGKCNNNAESGKSTCWNCSKDAIDAASVTMDTGNVNISDPASAANILSKAGVTVTPGPLVETLTLVKAEEIFTSKGMSRSMIKRFRKHYKLVGKGGNRELRAKATLQKLSQNVISTLSNGYVH